MKAALRNFVDTLGKEIDARRNFLGESPIETIYFGGGTPSLLDPESFCDIADLMKREFNLEEVEEFTIEVNPDDVCASGGEDKLAAWRSCGVNRVSMGVQSFVDSHLRWMNRRHSASQAEEAFRILRSQGFDNLSIDLIFGFEALSDSDWEFNIGKAVELAPEHISCYQLSIDPESALAVDFEAGRYRELSQEKCAAQYELLCDALAAAGYEHYEISNFAREGRFSRHNSSYWSREPYLGLGPGAHSFDGDRFRCWNGPLPQWLRGEFAIEGEHLTDNDVFNERVMLSLRTARGTDSELIQGAVRGLEPAPDGRWRIPENSWFISDAIISGFMRMV